MRRHAFIQKLAVGLIAAQLIVAGIAVWGARREPIWGMVLRPVLAGARKLEAGLTVEVLQPRLPWHSRHALPLRGDDAVIEADNLLRLPVPSATAYTRRAGVTLRSGPGPADPILETYPVGQQLELAGRDALLLDGAWLRDTHPLHEVVLSGGRVKGFIEREALRADGPSRGDWLSATLSSLRAGRLEEAQARAEAATDDPFGEALRDALLQARAHRAARALHPSFELPRPPPALLPYDDGLWIETVTHLHDGRAQERRYARERWEDEPPARGFIATGEQPLLDAAVETASALGLLPQGAELEVHGAVEGPRSMADVLLREPDELPWLEVSAEVIPPVRLEVDLTAALTRGGAVTQLMDPPQAPRRLRGFVPRGSVSLLAPTERALRDAVHRPTQGVSPRTRHQLAAILDAQDPPTTAELERRMESAWEDVVPRAVAELAVQLAGGGDLDGVLVGAEVVTACGTVAGCQPLCGLPLLHALPTARTRPAAPGRADARYLYLRLRGREVTPELPLSIVARFRQGGPCGPEDSPAIASFLYAPQSAADHDVWIRLPDRPLASIAVVAAPAAQALHRIERAQQRAGDEERPGRNPVRTLRPPSTCEAERVAAPAIP